MFEVVYLLLKSALRGALQGIPAVGPPSKEGCCSRLWSGLLAPFPPVGNLGWVIGLELGVELGFHLGESCP